MIKFQARVQAVGPFVSEFLDHQILVLFGMNAPPELAEFAVLHDGEEPAALLRRGDRLQIDGGDYQILAVGEIANQNLMTIGHLVLKFNGEDEAELPGDVCVEARPIPPIEIGTEIRIEGARDE